MHDELDLPPAKVRVKVGGGNAGHNGLRSISAHIGNDYKRVRLGIGHPGDKALVHPSCSAISARRRWAGSTRSATRWRARPACRGPGRQLPEQGPSGDRGGGLRRGVQRLSLRWVRVGDIAGEGTMDGSAIRAAAPSDRPQLRRAVIELHDHERRLHSSAPAWRSNRRCLFGVDGETRRGRGAVLIAEIEGAFAGFVAGWLEVENHIEETPRLELFRLCLGHLRPAGLSRPAHRL